MFAKSERFASTEKNDIPGPGQYNVNDLNGTHKRYGFLSQSGRFLGEHPEEDDYSSGTLSTNSDLGRTGQKLQKEYELLLSKSKRLESTLETVENEKKALQLAKEMELAEVRSKNASLQKTIQRQEKQIKSDSWQKKQEQLKEEYERRLAEKERELGFLEDQLESRTADLQDTRQTYAQAQSEQSEALRQANEQILQLKATSASQQARLAWLEENLAEANHQRQQQKDTLDQLQHSIQHSQHQHALALDQKEHALEQQQSLIGALRSQFECYRKYTQQLLQSQCSLHLDELKPVLNELCQAKKWINTQGIHLQHLKSDLHWLTLQAQQQADIIQAMTLAASDHVRFYHSFKKQFIDK